MIGIARRTGCHLARCRLARYRLARYRSALCAAAFCLTAALLVFGPGDLNAAESAGTNTPGGEGGRTIVVTTLDDSGPGSLRSAVKAKGARVITFRVAGTIRLTKALSVLQPYVTIDGETAPSPGITLQGGTLSILTHDVIVRHLRVRVGDRPGKDAHDRDGIRIAGNPKKGQSVHDVLIDHCSISWAVDEGISTWFKGTRAITVRNSIISEALDDSIHPKGRHSAGFLVGRYTKGVLIERNLFAHNDLRNPVLAGGTTAAVVNNVVYNPGAQGIRLQARNNMDEPTLAAIVGNLVLAGPDSSRRMGMVKKGLHGGSRIYLRDNLEDGLEAFRTDNSVFQQMTFDPLAEEPPIWSDGIELSSASDLLDPLLRDVGARPWDRDATDRRIVEEVRQRGGGIRDRPPADEFQ